MQPAKENILIGIKLIDMDITYSPLFFFILQV
jgi:hypothetical protein